MANDALMNMLADVSGAFAALRAFEQAEGRVRRERGAAVSEWREWRERHAACEAAALDHAAPPGYNC